MKIKKYVKKSYQQSILTGNRINTETLCTLGTYLICTNCTLTVNK